MKHFRNTCWFYGFGVFTGILHAVVVKPTFSDGLLIGGGVFATLAEWYRIKLQETEGCE